MGPTYVIIYVDKTVPPGQLMIRTLAEHEFDLYRGKQNINLLWDGELDEFMDALCGLINS